MEDTNVDYYKVLQSERTASIEELKRNYQRLILSCHPDKVSGGSEHDAFLLIQKAWSVLRDPQSRKQYDAAITCQEHEELLIFERIALSEMVLDVAGNHVYPCRCGSLYSFEASVSDDPVVVVPCCECSFAIQINTIK